MIIAFKSKNNNEFIDILMNVNKIDESHIYLSDGTIIGNLNRNNIEFIRLHNNPGWYDESDYRNPIIDPESNEIIGYQGLNSIAISWIQDEINNGAYDIV